jgi:hypothetical protein
LARDEFSRRTIDHLAKRVGMKCSCPACRKPTSGPDARDGVTNIGVAAHITAASCEGPRYDNTLTSEQRSDINNGIWLCQTHAKLIDDDELTYTATILRGWKIEAESVAAVEALGYTVIKTARFDSLEEKAPKLLAEMRADLKRQHLIREFILLPSINVSYNGSSNERFVYYHEVHEYLSSLMTIMGNLGAIYDITFNDVPRYNFTEDFVSYLIGGIN